MVSPLDIDVRMLHKCVQKPCGLRSSVEYIAYYMKPVHCKALYYVRKGAYYLVGSAGGDNGFKDGVMIAHLV